MTSIQDDELLTAVQQMKEAITNKGSHPKYHERVMLRHQWEWPVLWEAINSILAVYDKRTET